jgi:PAS domain-containing protein
MLSGRGGFMESNRFKKQFTGIEDACALAQAIVDTVREPVLIFDKELRVIAASRSFYSVFEVSPPDTQGKLLCELGNGQWDIPKLRLLLEKIIPEHGVMEGYEVEHEFPGLGHRMMAEHDARIITIVRLSCSPRKRAMRGCLTLLINSPHAWPAMATLS